MKKILVMFVMACLAVVMAGCSSSNTPKGVTEQAVKCFMKKDFKGYFDLYEFPEGKEDIKAGYTQMLEEKAAKQPEAFDLKSYEIVNEQVDEEAGKAKVTVKFVNNKGEEKEQHFDLLKNDKGEWKIKFKK